MRGFLQGLAGAYTIAGIWFSYWVLSGPDLPQLAPMFTTIKVAAIIGMLFMWCSTLAAGIFAIAGSMDSRDAS